MRSLLLRWLASLLLVVGAAHALKFDLIAHSGSENQKKERCIRNFVGQETLVVVTATVDGYKGDGMVINMHVRKPRRLKKKGLMGGSLSTHRNSRDEQMDK